MSHATTVGNLHEGLNALGVSAALNKDMYEGATAAAEDPDAQFSLLERFPAPPALFHLNPCRAAQTIAVATNEFTSLCPITGQPDFATIKIEYRPNKWCVESKSLKLYLLSFRNRGEFHEQCVNRITNDLARLLNPLHLQVVGEFTPRGGIPIWPTSVFYGNGKDEFAAEDYAPDVDPDQHSLPFEHPAPFGGEVPAPRRAIPQISEESYDALLRYSHAVYHGHDVPEGLRVRLRGLIPCIRQEDYEFEEGFGFE